MAISTAAVTRTIARSQNFDSSSCFGAGDDCGPFRCLGRKLTSVRSGFPSVGSWRSRSMESPRFHPERILAGVLGAVSLGFQVFARQASGCWGNFKRELPSHGRGQSLFYIIYIMRNSIFPRHSAPQLDLALDHLSPTVHRGKFRALQAEKLSNRRRCFQAVMNKRRHLRYAMNHVDEVFSVFLPSSS